MGVLLQAFYKHEPNNAVPSPSDGDVTIPVWWDRLASQAQDFRLSGFTAVWLPPVLKTSQGSNPKADGYGPFDDYDLGSKHQMGSVATRFGNRDELKRAVASMRAAGLDVYLDMVEHHRSGDTSGAPFVFRYPGADGTAAEGRFPKDPQNFVPQVPRDPNLGGPVKDDAPFGRELAPINGRPPKGYVMSNLIDACDWLTRSLDVQGYRLDDVKGLSTDFLFPFLTSKSMAGKFAVGEFFDGARNLVEGWISNPTGMKGRSSAFDFPLKFALNAMCNTPGAFNMANLDHAGLAGIDPLNAVTFVENHDTDLSPQNKIAFNKALAYAYILTSEGYPCVYYRDYSTDVGCYGLKPEIDNLIWIHEKIADGPTLQRFLDRQFIVYERLGGSHLLVGLNNDAGESHTVNVFTGFGPNVSLHDYTGHADDVTTAADGSVTITIPPNINGLGYVCYSRQGLGGTAFDVVSTPVTQDFEGAIDLDILPATPGAPMSAGLIWCSAATPIVAVLKPDVAGWTAATNIKLDILGPDKSVLASLDFNLASAASNSVLTSSILTGFHTLQLTTTNTPPANPKPSYVLTVTYTGDLSFVPPKPPPDPAVRGKWAPSFSLSNVAIHAHVLPTGDVLYWGRRKQPTDNSFASLNEHSTDAFLFTPSTGNIRPTGSHPLDQSNNPINLFCSSHTFLPDGRLIVVGGHLFDSQGIDCATIYDPVADSWTAASPMGNGRWYPTAITLADGSVMACSGSFATGTPAPAPTPPPTATNNTPQIWNGGSWANLQPFDEAAGLQHFLYPRLHLAPDGRVFMSGAGQDSFFFDPTGTGTWKMSSARAAGPREYAPSVMYDEGKIIFIGGGNDAGTNRPTNIVEIIDLNANPPSWKPAQSMNFRRRQHNATLLPDGTVLVTGGTQGGGGPSNGFNDLTSNQPVHAAELWDPATNTWTLMESEDTDRCYHSTAVLLPDGRVLSAGGGEYQPDATLFANDPQNSHTTGQIFSPPYLFAASRPDILSSPAEVTLGKTFDVGTTHPENVLKASLVRLSSVTHSFNQGQRINFLPSVSKAGAVTLTAPPNANVCPPGHYLLFLLDKNLIPSEGKIVKIIGQPKAPTRTSLKVLGPELKNQAIIAKATRPPVLVGLTPTCPYGLSACWAGAYAGLKQLSGVDVVRPLADAEKAVAFLYLNHDGLPDLKSWPIEFARAVNGSYVWRGVEMTLTSNIQAEGTDLFLPETAARPKIQLLPLQEQDKVQLDLESGVPKPLPIEESSAFELLSSQQRSQLTATWAITGPIQETSNGYVLEVRKFELSSTAS
jgi:hypothetical protein